ncbi:CDP-glycerol glycerophosphotransferase family protein [Bacillus sp. EB01]|uniref:CDP-glycerol glycerophosphotransferase family protein n=1 Tax=Bacillus sp. EB01 TaxID=1347086 RepID=UPI0005C4E996|nr:CDP-glycerol glycerophosphotransferase family protein [Bacillus sp. EB01]
MKTVTTEKKNTRDYIDLLMKEKDRQDDKDWYSVEHNVLDLRFNGPTLTLEGYCYINDIPILKCFDVKKRLVLFDSKQKKYWKFILEDITVDNVLSLKEAIDPQYRWAGYKGTIDLSNVENNMPLKEGNYVALLEIVIFQKNDKLVKRVPLGDIRRYLKDGFYTSKMEHYSANSQLLYNVMARYDLNTKSLQIESHKVKSINPSELYGDIKNKTEKPNAFYRLMRTKGFMFFYYLFHLFPVNKRKVLFASDSRDEVGGNLKFVYDEMKKQNLGYEYRFMFKENSFVKKSILEIIRLAYDAATSKATLLEENYPMFSQLRIRKNTDLIQLWHGAGAFKKFGYSRMGQPGGPKITSKDHRNYTKAIVSSKNITPQYAEGFDIEEEKIIPLGIPRTDIFFDEEYKELKRKELYEAYPFLKGKKVILFAPTFRGKGRKEAHYPFENLDFEKLYKNLKDEYVFLFKLHFIVLNKVTIPYKYADFFYDFTSYREVNDLLLITDLLITDYSSICFEFSLLDKPMLFYAYDVENYISKRGFYFEYQSFIPGSLVKNTDQMVAKIIKNDFQKEKIKLFRDYFFDYQDGKASERVVNHLIKGTE